MKVYWWQGGLHLEPESQEEREALHLLTSRLNFIDLREEVPSGPVGPVKGIDQNSVIAV